MIPIRNCAKAIIIDQISAYRFYPKKLVEYLGKPLPDVVEYWGTVE